MNMQIKSIILYNNDGKTRILPFNLGKVNIITGKSGTGKSAIIEIIDYCLGRSDFKIPEGKIRDSVAWYGVLFQVGETQVFVAKPAPQKNAISQSEVYYKVGTEISVPPLSKLIPNSNDEAIVKHFSRLIGISPNLKTPEKWQSKISLEANIRHTCYYLFQKQGVIANQSILFHRQQEPYIHQTIKDTLPYFLGAVQEDRLKIEQELRSARRSLKIAERNLEEAEFIVSEQLNRGQALVVEAQQVGLIKSDLTPANTAEIFEVLQRVLKWKPNTSPPEPDDRFLQLQEELNNLRQDFQKKSEQIKTAEIVAQESEGYSSEANQQRLRLESINLFDSKDDKLNICPLCSSKISLDIPEISALKSALKKIHKDIKTVEHKRPRLRKYIQTLKDEREKLLEKIEEKKFSIEAVLAEKKAGEEIRDTNSRIARVVGRISLYLDTVKFVDERSPLRTKLKEAEELVEYYEKQLDETTTEGNLNWILSLISKQMTELAKKLELEHIDFAYRFDINKLTVVADRPERPITMERMGGGANWLGCHLITYLALHKHFINQNRPVPNFLIIDQPSQIYFPTKESYLAMEGISSEELKEANADILAVKRMFNLLFDVCEELAQNFQIIITEHANLEDDKRFQDALVETSWKGGNALIPQDWID
jgi:hypothetical protein